MKRIVWILIGCVVVAAALIPMLNKEYAVENNIVNDKKISTETFTRPENIEIEDDSVIVKIIDIEGAEISLTDYNSICQRDYASLNYNGGVLSNVFQEQKVLPIQMENGPYYMFFIENIEEYFFDGTKAHILFKNGEEVSGMPVKDYEISGKSIYGDVIIPMENIHYAKFNSKIPAELTEKSRENLKVYLDFTDNGYAYWPQSFDKYNFSITTQANFQINFSAPIFVYDKHGCDDNWIPCKSYQVWKLSNYFVTVRNGTIVMKIPVNNIELAIFNKKEKENDNKYYLDITLKNKEQLKDVPLYNGTDGYESELCVNVGILGLIENGFAFLPVDRIKQLELLSI